MPDLVGIFAGALFTFAAAWSVGRAVFGRLALPFALTLALGAALLSHAVFLLMVAGVAGRVAFLVLGLGCLAGALAGKRPRLPAAAWPAWLLIPYGVLYLVHALAPEIQPDGYTYHLGLVREWLRTGGFPERVGFYEMLPQGMEMLFSFAYAFGGAPAAKLVHFGFLALTVPLLLETARRLRLPEAFGWTAALLYVASPLVGVTATCAYNDTALAFYVLAAFCLLLGEAGETGAEAGRLRWLAAGVLAGFCYSIKFPGLLIVGAVLACVLIRKRLSAAAWTAAGAAAMILPWTLRNFAWSGNPFAPMFNGWFPNPHFHLAMEREVSQYLRSYEGIGWSAIPWELAVSGLNLHGLVGPLLFLLPLALLGLRHKAGRLLLAAGFIAFLPWLFNIGARFLLPALPFLCLALVAAVGRRAAWALALVALVAGWPAVVDRYAHPAAWRLRGFPWQAALRIEAEQDYLRRTLYEYRVAEMVARHAGPKDRVLDLTGAAAGAYLDVEVLNWWQYANAQRAKDALGIAASSGRGALYRLESRWEPEVLSALRFHLPAGADLPWSIQEVEILDGGQWRGGRRGWRVQAEPNVWEAPLAFDGNPVSRWATWEPRRAGMHLTVHFDKPLPVGGARLTCYRAERAFDVEFSASVPGGAWRALSGRPSRLEMPEINLRPAAGRVLRREGFAFVLARPGKGGLEAVGRDLIDNAWDWGLSRVEWEGAVCLLRLR